MTTINVKVGIPLRKKDKQLIDSNTGKQDMYNIER